MPEFVGDLRTLAHEQVASFLPAVGALQPKLRCFLRPVDIQIVTGVEPSWRALRAVQLRQLTNA